MSYIYYARLSISQGLYMLCSEWLSIELATPYVSEFTSMQSSDTADIISDELFLIYKLCLLNMAAADWEYHSISGEEKDIFASISVSVSV